MANLDFNKLTSGKFLFTIASAGVFVYCSIKQILEPKDIMYILSLVVVFYFNKKSDHEEIK